jgi:hypothetical protein
MITRLPLVIDPVVSYASMSIEGFGGADTDDYRLGGCHVGADGSLYLAGETIDRRDWPRPMPFKPTWLA